MEGFIIAMNRSIREDMVVRILTRRHYYSLYRFYGVRHSILHVGRKIDFEIEHQGVYMPRLRNMSHLYRDYERFIDKVFVWQQFCYHLDRHFNEAKELEPFYFELLDRHVSALAKQEARRLVCSMYVKLLEHEGRLYKSDVCFICGEKLPNIVALSRGYLLACLNCIHQPKTIAKDKILNVFTIKSLMNLDDNECQVLYEVLGEGL